MEIDKNSDIFQFTFGQLVNLSKMEIRRFIILSLASVIVLGCALCAVIVATVMQLSIHMNINQVSIFISIVALALIVILVIAVRSARLSAIRLRSVIEPAKEAFSFTSRSSSLDDESGKHQQSPSSSAQTSEVSKDRLPRTAARFYKIIEESKSSALNFINQFLEPITGIQSLVKKQPVLSVIIAAICGNFLAHILFKSKKIATPPNASMHSYPNMNPQPEKAKDNVLYSTLVDLSIMGVTYAIQTYIKEVINKKTSESPNPNQQNSRPTGHIIPFELRKQKSR